MDHTMWKSSMTNCAQKWWWKLCAIVFAVTWAFGKMCYVLRTMGKYNTMFVINLDILMRTPGSSIPRMSNDLLIITCWWMFVSSAATLHQVVSIFFFPILIWYVVFLGPAVHRAPTTWEGPIPSNEQAETRITHSSYNNSQIRDLCKEQVRQNWLPLLIIMQSFLIWK